MTTIADGNPTSWTISRRPCAGILSVPVDAVDMDLALALIDAHLAGDGKGFVCAVGVHGILESLQCNDLAEAYTQSILNVPDGAPTVWVGRMQGHAQMNHVTGPALMQEMFGRVQFASLSHFFYGGKPGVAAGLAAAMSRRFPGARIAGTYTPPFRDLNEEEEREFVARIGALRPDIIWVGISTPRQELWMRRMLPRVDARLMFGVGAAFDFHTGRIRECPSWVKRAGFQWLHRFMQDPRRLWRRNLSNMRFLWYIALQLSGLRSYPLRFGFSTADSPGDRTADQTCSDAEPIAAARWRRR
jgi:N-acetylglucosaminyldiphosphoundecaprenol N-acetyl-beta-D-mannosaminyltransferase